MPSSTFLAISSAAALLVTHGLAQDPGESTGKGSSKLEDLLAATKTPALTIPATSTTQKEFYRRFGEWAKKRWQSGLRDELEALNVDDPEKKAAQMWDWFAAGAAGGGVGKFTEEMRDRISVNANGPITQFIVGNMALESRFWEESRKRLHLSVDDTNGVRGDVLIGALAAARLNGEKDRPPDAKLSEKTLNFLTQAFAEGRFSEPDGEFLTHIICCRLAGQTHERLGERLIAVWEKASMPEWVKLYAIGKARAGMGWATRGGGWANTVTEKGWEGFEKQLTEAANCFRKSWALRPERPEAAMEMIAVAKAGYTPPEETMRLWFDRSIAAECDHRFAYAKMIDGLRPRWRGSLDQMLAFGVACARTERFDTEVPGKLITMLDNLGEELADWRPVLQNAEIAGLLLKIRKAQVAQAKENGASALRYSQAYLTMTAMLSGDRKTALATMDAMYPDGQPVTMPIAAVNWAAGWNLDWSAERAEAQIEESEGSDAWEKAKEAREKRYFDTALTELDTVTVKCPAAKGWLKGWQSLVSFERDFAKGEWTPMPHDLVSWQPGYGDWKWVAPQDIVGKLSINQSLYLYSRARLGENFELRGKVRLETDAKFRKFSFGVLFGHEMFRKQDAQPEYVALFTSQDRDHFRSMIGHRHFLQDIKKTGANVKMVETNTFRIERRGTRVNAWVNDEQALKDAEIPEDLSNGEGSVGLMAYPYVAQEPIHFMDLEARRL